jgi:hypothetical protein
MRPPSLRVFSFLAFALAASWPHHVWSEAADEPRLSGAWKLVDIQSLSRNPLLQPLSETELFVIRMRQDGGRLTAVVADAFPNLENTEVLRVARDDGGIVLELSVRGQDATFRGKPGPGGKFFGLFHWQGRQDPSRLESTDVDSVSRRRDNSLYRSVLSAVAEADVGSRVRRLGALTERAPGSPLLSDVYFEIMRSASAAALTDRQVRNFLEEWVHGARPFGEDYVAEVWTKALSALSGQKAHAALCLEMATRAEKEIAANAPLEMRARFEGVLAESAKLAGRTEQAERAAAKLRLLEAELDDAYRQKVPPFKPDVSAGRRDKKADRVVLVELFTGAQCAPCVPADVAFDALSTTYKPSEMIGIQYHLHVPGPDPLTNPDCEARADYYPDVQGTPTIYFNGKSPGPAGGPSLAASKERYDDFRRVVESGLDGKKGASIDLQIRRTGDQLKITASAEARPSNKEGAAENKPGGETAKKSALRLRLALIEEEIRYTGGNGLRFHHHVVRAMPGGVDGKELVDGKGNVEVTVNLADVRTGLEEYLARLKRANAPFPKPMPEIELKDLSLVAFVQDDDDKSVLHAVLAPVGESK